MKVIAALVACVGYFLTLWVSSALLLSGFLPIKQEAWAFAFFFGPMLVGIPTYAVAALISLVLARFGRRFIAILIYSILGLGLALTYFWVGHTQVIRSHALFSAPIFFAAAMHEAILLKFPAVTHALPETHRLKKIFRMFFGY
jgi:hypothetical protein